MDEKNYAEVLIDGTVFTLGGAEEEGYLRQVAAYLNDKIGSVKKCDGFSKQSVEYQNVMIQLNIADDYFKEQERADFLAEQKAALEKETYSLKHELITSQMNLETAEKTEETLKTELEAAKKELEDTKKQFETTKKEYETQKAELERMKALQAAAAAAAPPHHTTRRA